MLIKDLIKLLEEEYEKQKSYGPEWGEPTICIDAFDWDDENHRYLGIDPNIIIDSSEDGVYRILMADHKKWKKWKEENG